MTNDSLLLDQVTTIWVQSAIRSMLYYGRALDNTILPTLNQLGTQQALPTQNTKKTLEQLLDYVSTMKMSTYSFMQQICIYMSIVMMHIYAYPMQEAVLLDIFAC